MAAVQRGQAPTVLSTLGFDEEAEEAGIQRHHSHVGQQRVLDVWRPCLNAKPINPHMLREYYKQSSDREIDATISHKTWMVRTDVCGAFQQFDLSDEPLELSAEDRGRSGPPWSTTLFGLTSSQDLC
jgi:hypothetical protein